MPINFNFYDEKIKKLKIKKKENMEKLERKIGKEIIKIFYDKDSKQLLNEINCENLKKVILNLLNSNNINNVN